jgi:hypothetical protein
MAVMSDEVEVETHDLQETIEEIHKDREEREQEERRTHWTRYIALTTAVLAAFAAVAALESGGLANESMLSQLKASDQWSEYQSSRQKSHLYTVVASQMLDQGVTSHGKAPSGSSLKMVKETADTRLTEVLGQIGREDSKAKQVRVIAEKYEKTAEKTLEKHHKFAYSVAMLQVAIALGAVSALTRMKSLWFVSGAMGLAGIGLFVWGFLA